MRTKMKFKKKLLLCYLICTLGIGLCNEPRNLSLVEKCVATGGRFPASNANCKCSGCPIESSVNLACSNNRWTPNNPFNKVQCETCQKVNCYSHYAPTANNNIVCPMNSTVEKKNLKNGAVKQCFCKSNCAPVTLTCNNEWTWNSGICNSDKFVTQKWPGIDDNLQATSQKLGGNVTVLFSCKNGVVPKNQKIRCRNGRLDMVAPTCTASAGLPQPVSFCDVPKTTKYQICDASGGSFPSSSAICKCPSCENITESITCNKNMEWSPIGNDFQSSCVRCQRAKCSAYYEPDTLNCPSDNSTTTKICTCIRNCAPVTMTCLNNSGKRNWTYDDSICDQEFKDEIFPELNQYLLMTTESLESGVVNMTFACWQEFVLNGTVSAICKDGILQNVTDYPTCVLVQNSTPLQLGIPEIVVLVLAVFVLTIISIPIISMLCRERRTGKIQLSPAFRFKNPNYRDLHN